MSDIKLDLLRTDQIYGPNRLKIFDQIGTKASPTDFAIACGAYVAGNIYTEEGNKLENRTGWYWTKTDDGDNDARVVGRNGDSYFYYVNSRSGCVRPALPFSEIRNICSNGVRGTNGELIVECGEFPQQSVSKQLEDDLNCNLKLELLKEVDFIPTDSTAWDDYKTGFNRIDQKVYEYEGERYTLVKANSFEDEFTLSNGKTYKRGDLIWIKNSKVKWKVDEDSGIVFPEKLISAGVQFNKERNYQGDFEKTDLYRYMNTYLVKAIFSIYEKEISKSNITDVNDNTSMKIESLNHMNEFLEEEIIRMQQQISKNNEMIDAYSKNNSIQPKVFQKK